jgi:hypothetical protein
MATTTTPNNNNSTGPSGTFLAIGLGGAAALLILGGLAIRKREQIAIQYQTTRRHVRAISKAVRSRGRIKGEITEERQVTREARKRRGRRREGTCSTSGGSSGTRQRSGYGRSSMPPLVPSAGGRC